MDEQQKAKAQAQARYNARQEAKKKEVSIFHKTPKRRPQGSSYQPPPAASAAAAPIAKPQTTPAAPLPAVPAPAMSANQPNGQGGQGGRGANLALPGKPLGQTFPNRSTPKSEPTAEQGQAFPDTVTTTPERTPEQEAHATRRLQEEVEKYKGYEAKDYQTIAEQNDTISRKDAEISALRSRVDALEKEKRSWDHPYQEALAGTKIALEDQQDTFNRTLADQKKRYDLLEKHLADTNNARYKDGQTIQQLNEDLQKLGQTYSHVQTMLDLYQDGTIMQESYRAQWLKDGEQEVADLRAANAELSAACEKYEEAKVDAEQALNQMLASQAHAANFGPTSTIQQMQKMHHQNDSSSNLSDNALTRHDSQTSQQLDKIQLASGRLMDEMIDSSDMGSESDSEDERDDGEEDDNGEKTQTTIQSTAEAQPQPPAQDTVQAQQQLSKGLKPDAASLDSTFDPVPTGRFEKMSEARKTKELYEYDRRLQNAIQKGKQKDGCIDRQKSNIEGLNKVIQDRNVEITGLKQEIESKNDVIHSQKKEIKSANSTHEEAAKAASQQAERDFKENERLRRSNMGDNRIAKEAVKDKEAAETKLDSVKQDLRKAEEALEKSDVKLEETKTKLQETETKLEEALAKANVIEDLTGGDGQPKAEDEKKRDEIVPGSELQATESDETHSRPEFWNQVGWRYLIPLLLFLLGFYFTVESYQMRQLWLDANELTVQHVIDIQSGHASIMPAPILAFFIWFENSFVEPSSKSISFI